MGERWLTIGEVAERAGVSTSALRFYERQGLVTSERTPGGQRRYRREVLRRVAFVTVAQRVGLTLREVRAALDGLPRRRVPTARDWSRLSAAWRDQLDERIGLLVGLRDQLGTCIGCGCLSLGTCGLTNPDDRAATTGSGPRFLVDGADGATRSVTSSGHGRGASRRAGASVASSDAK